MARGKETDNVDLDALIAERDEARRRKHSAYDERNRLVAWLAAQYPSSLERHPANESWDNSWRWVLYIDSPVGQLSWHIRDNQLRWFDHVPRHQGRRWDGTSTADKYARLAEWTAQLANRRPST
ncbi:hypothetical protein [Sulfobacillus harzensis]|uniref:WDGH domain-containing protein n=1 Tax=Sulfobacillus harzensis TaxID=2729629 RepID=A0A7Y0Q4Z9_9FIRM|nr:hypothetical protein [Sulfobacillus harzensis]NMP24935.1 hypothetical protein [Sulfobacillus harzensis]